jgi:hypothetical protein
MKWYKHRTFVLDEMLLLRVAVAGLVGLLAIILSLRNRVGARPSGCWARLLEIEEGHKAWLDLEVVAPSDGDVQRAWEIANAYEAQWTKQG